MVRLIGMPANCKLLFPRIDVRHREEGCKEEQHKAITLLKADILFCETNLTAGEIYVNINEEMLSSVGVTATPKNDLDSKASKACEACEAGQIT